MMRKSDTGNLRQYETWYEFKKELETILWCYLANDIWLQIKPQKPLPWNESDLKSSIISLSD
ncbi:MAG: hypothetical protein PHU23_07140 [Dehalococcoidales bacterium]|nr:hypothetical protein [Dehalococcoidales bacterium]